MRKRSSLLTNILFVVVGIGVVSALLAIFYESPLQNRIEQKLFDLRTRLAPNPLESVPVAVVKISEATIEAANGDGTTDLSILSLKKITEHVLAGGPKAVVLLLTPQVFSYNDAAMGQLAELAFKDKRLILATFGLQSDQSDLPLIFSGVASQVVSADIAREFRRNVVRSIEIQNNTQLLTPLLTYIGRTFAQDSFTNVLHIQQNFGLSVDYQSSQGGEVNGKEKKGEKSGNMILNYRLPESFPQIDGGDLLEPLKNGGAHLRAHMAGSEQELLRNRVVLIGYSTFRPWDRDHREATHINTPWQRDGADANEGMPLVFLFAVALSNLLTESWLHPLPDWVAVLQTCLITIGSLVIWRLKRASAAFLFLLIGTATLFLHAALFGLGNRFLPLSEAFMFGAISTIAGGLYRLQYEARLRAAFAAQEAADSEVARVQDRFLNRFGEELSVLNQKIHEALTRESHLAQGSGTIQKVYSRALASCDELNEYLHGIRQFAATRKPESEHVHMRKISLSTLLEKSLLQFESRKIEAGITVEITNQDVLNKVDTYTDETLVLQILYNLISNAIKYSPKGGKVKITCDFPKKQSLVSLKFKDEGPGIDPAYHDRIFEKFYRVKDDLVFRVKGHGLGLFLSKYFSDKIGAKITVHSILGEGAEFTLTLPRVT